MSLTYIEAKKSLNDKNVCVNCKHCLNAIAIGVGLRCKLEENFNDKGIIMLIPSFDHTCQYYEREPNKSKKPTQ